MERADIAVARFAEHDGAATAVETLAKGGFDMKQQSIVGRGYHTDESIIGCYNAGDRIRFRGKYGAFWADCGDCSPTVSFLPYPRSARWSRWAELRG